MPSRRRAGPCTPRRWRAPTASPPRLLRRGWDAVLYSGDGPAPLPARRAMALVRLADAHLPFIVVAPEVRAGDLSAAIRGVGPDMVLAPDPGALPALLDEQLAAAGATRPGRGAGPPPPARAAGRGGARRGRSRARRAERAGARDARPRARLVLRCRLAGRGRRDAALRRDLARRGRRSRGRRLRHRLPGADRSSRAAASSAASWTFRPPGVDRRRRRATPTCRAPARRCARASTPRSRSPSRSATTAWA